MTPPVQDINRKLAAITEAHANGELDRVSFRRQRRELICTVSGESVPSMPLSHDLAQSVEAAEDDTQPALRAVKTPDQTVPASRPEPSPVTEAAPADDEITSSQMPGTGKVSSLKLTLLLLLVAMAGLGGLLWFVLR